MMTEIQSIEGGKKDVVLKRTNIKKSLIPSYSLIRCSFPWQTAAEPLVQLMKPGPGQTNRVKISRQPKMQKKINYEIVGKN